MPRKAYSTDMTDEACVLIAPLLPPARTGGRRRTTDLRVVLNAIFYLQLDVNITSSLLVLSAPVFALDSLRGRQRTTTELVISA